LTTWNVTWFGDETNSPAAGKKFRCLAKKTVKMYKQLDADIYAVEEVSDVLLLKWLSEMNDYSYVFISGFISSDLTSPRQVGFIYKK
jgi:hypothetical protein